MADPAFSLDIYGLNASSDREQIEHRKWMADRKWMAGQGWWGRGEERVFHGVLG